MENQDPYKPPRVNVEQPAELKPGSPMVAVLVGALVDMGGTLFSGVLVSVAYAIQLGLSGMTPEEMTRAFEMLPWNSWPSIVGVILGSLSSVLGGYVCARIVRRDEYRWAAVLAGISVALGFMMGGTRSGVWWDLLFSLLTVACVLAGAWLRLRSVRHAPASANARLSA